MRPRSRSERLIRLMKKSGEIVRRSPRKTVIDLIIENVMSKYHRK